MGFHREGYLHIIIASLVWAIIGYVTYNYIGASYAWISWIIHILLFLVWFWVLSFFRMPKRAMTFNVDDITSPCDGKVVVIEEVYEPEYFKDQRIQVSVFMSPLNVHVNRSPIDGKVLYTKYHPGKFLVAWHPKSSTDNERTSIVISNNHVSLLLRQVAGAMARRIKYYVKESDEIKQNDEFGFIKFGSRVDIYLPLGTEINVAIGEVVKGGVSVLAKIK